MLKYIEHYLITTFPVSPRKNLKKKIVCDLPMSLCLLVSVCMHPKPGEPDNSETEISLNWAHMSFMSKG